MNIHINEDYFVNLVKGMQMDALKNSEGFKSFYTKFKEERRKENRDNKSKYTSIDFLKENRGLIEYEPSSKARTSKKYANTIRSIAMQIYTKSLYYCPIDTGRLKKSSKIQSIAGGEAYKISYSTKYVLFVHELLHLSHIAPTRAKFLEDAAVDIINLNKDSWNSHNIIVSIDMLYSQEEVAVVISSYPSSYYGFKNSNLFNNRSYVENNIDPESISNVSEDIDIEDDEYYDVDDISDDVDDINENDALAYLLRQRMGLE